MVILHRQQVRQHVNHHQITIPGHPALRIPIMAEAELVEVAAEAVEVIVVAEVAAAADIVAVVGVEVEAEAAAAEGEEDRKLQRCILFE